MTPTRALRVLHLVPGARWSGREMQAVDLAAGLAAKGHHPAIAAPEGSPQAGRAAGRGLEVVALPLGRLRRLAALRRLVSEGGWQILHLHDPAALAGLGVACVGLAAPPRVVAAHGDIGYGGRTPRIGATAGRATHLIAVSEWVWSALVRSGVPEDRISVVPTGIDLRRFAAEPAASRPLREAGRRALGLPERAFAVGTLIALTRRAGVEHLIEAGRRIRSGETPPGEPEIKIVVAGEGSHRAALERAAARSGMGDAVLFAGWVEETPPILAALDVHVHPALGGSAFPLALRESMALGVPAVASDLMGVREIIDNGRHGLIVPPGDPAALALNIMKLRRDPSLARQIGHAGSLKVQRYGLQAMIDRTEEVYFRLVR